MIVAVRSDEKLVHGQILNAWKDKFNPTHLLVVDDDLQIDTFVQNVYLSLVPLGLVTIFSSINNSKKIIEELEEKNVRILLLVKTPVTALKLLKEGIEYDELLLADKKYIAKKIEILEVYKRAINELIDLNIKVNYQYIPDNNKIEISKYVL